MRRLEHIGGVSVARDRPFLILEAGVNHEGSLDRAFELIDAAAETGADMIKFQSYKAETLASRNSPAYWDRDEEPADSQYSLFRRYDGMDDDHYRQMARRCRDRGLLFASTPFDFHFVDMLEPLMPVYKIASADLSNFPLLRRVATKGKPVLISVGAAYLGEVEKAVRLLDEAGAPAVVPMHCTLEYPTPLERANLADIAHLRRVFPDLTIGWSDHVPPDPGCHSLLVAWMQGADVLEKHFTLDKSLRGNDHYHAMDPDDVRDFLALQRRTQEMLGDGRKTVGPHEQTARKYARRSLVFTRDLPAGSILRKGDLTVKRPGTGMAPKYMDLALGSRLRRDVSQDEVVQWPMLIERED